MSDPLLHKKLSAVWRHTGMAPRWRYVPKATRAPSWRVWDRAAQKFLSDKELAALSLEDLAKEEFFT